MKPELKQAIIILHEIYGINKFIKNTCQEYKTSGYDVYCPNLIHRCAYGYEQTEKAYQNFMSNVGFDTYVKIIETIKQLKTSYDRVYVLGFSVGATIAFRCSEYPLCDGIIACYGSRIRDYADLTSCCPTLLLFADEPSFDVSALISSLQGKPYLQIHHFHAGHDFLNPDSKSYDEECANQSKILIFNFLRN